MSLANLLLILWARKYVVLIVLAVSVLTSILVSLVLPERYVATASVVVEQKSQPLTGLVLAPQTGPGYLSTQVEIINSHAVALKVVDTLRLSEQPAIREQFQSDTGGEGSLRDWMADNLLQFLRVRPSRDSNVIRIEFTGSDPLFAAELANAFADAYIQTSIELKVDPARRQAIWFEDQLSTLRERLETSQGKLSAFLKSNNVVGSDNQRLDMEMKKLDELAQQLVAAEGNTYDAVTKLRQISAAKSERAMQELPDILGNALLQNLKADLVRAQGRFAEIAERFDRNHPQYAGAAAEVASLKTQLQREIETTRNAMIQTARLSQDKEAELISAFERQKSRVIEMQNQRNEQEVLQREVESARQTYDDALKRTSQVRMESQLNQTDIAVLNPAIPPLEPTSPRKFLNALLGLICGGLLGIGAALLVELLDRRVRHARDISAGLGVPVLAELVLPRMAT